MPSLIKLLGAKEAENIIAEVSDLTSVDSEFYVTIRGREIRLPSLVTGLRIGARVVVAVTDDGKYIVGQEQVKDRERIEVVIDG